MIPEPSPEVKAVIRNFVAVQREKYGENWKEILSAKMAAEAEPFVSALLALRDRAKK